MKLQERDKLELQLDHINAKLQLIDSYPQNIGVVAGARHFNEIEQRKLERKLRIHEMHYPEKSIMQKVSDTAKEIKVLEKNLNADIKSHLHNLDTRDGNNEPGI